MARPKKNNADYFSHDASMRSDPKITYIRNKYGIMGYGIYCMMLEELTNSNNFEIQWSDMQCLLLSGDFGVSEQELQDCVDDMVKVQLLQLHEEILFSQGLKKRLHSVVEKRQKMRKIRKGKNASLGSTNPTQTYKKHSLGSTNEVCAAETPQSKVKESKVKESKNKGEEKKPSASSPKKFTPPTILEVKTYMMEKLDERAASIESEKFFHFYESKNRMVGKNKMARRKNAVGGWLARSRDGSFQTQKRKSITQLTGKEFYSSDNR